MHEARDGGVDAGGSPLSLRTQLRLPELTAPLLCHATASRRLPQEGFHLTEGAKTRETSSVLHRTNYHRYWQVARERHRSQGPQAFKRDARHEWLHQNH